MAEQRGTKSMNALDAPRLAISNGAQKREMAVAPEVVDFMCM